MPPDQGSQKVTIHTCFCSDPVHLQNDHRPDAGGFQARESFVGGTHGACRISPHDRPRAQVETAEDIVEAHLSPDLGDVVRSCTRLGRHNDPAYPDFKQPAGIQHRTDPRIDQQPNPAHATTKRFQQGHVIPRVLKGVQICHVDLLTAQGPVEPLQQDQRVCAGGQATLHRLVFLPVTVPGMDCGPPSNVKHRNQAHSGRILARP